MATPDSSKELLIAAAKSIFATRGYEGATVKEIAEAAGVNISLVSYYFGGKEGLYKTVLEQFGLNRLAAAQRILRPTSSAEEFRVRLKMFMEEFIEQHFADTSLAKILHRDCMFENELTQDVFKNTFIKVFQTLVDFVEQAAKDGFVRNDVPAADIAGNFFGALVHTLRSEDLAAKHFGRRLTDLPTRENYINNALRIFTEGVFPRESDS